MGRVPEGRKGENKKVHSEADLHQEGLGCPENRHRLLGSEVMLPPWASEVALAIRGKKLVFTEPGVTVRVA